MYERVEAIQQQPLSPVKLGLSSHMTVDWARQMLHNRMASGDAHQALSLLRGGFVRPGWGWRRSFCFFFFFPRFLFLAPFPFASSRLTLLFLVLPRISATLWRRRIWTGRRRRRHAPRV